MRNVYEREGKRIAEGSDNPIKRFGVTATAGFASGGEGMRDAIKAAKRDATASPTSPFQVAHQINRSKMGGAEGTISDVAHSMANMAPSIMLNTVLPGSGTFAFGLSAGGNAYNQALQEGKTYNEALAYGLMKGTSEAALQKILGGVGALTGKTVVGKLVGDNIDEVIRSIAKSPVGQTVLKKLINMAGEFTEEYLQEILEPVFRNIAFGENNEFKPFTKEALYAGVLGALTSAAMGTVTGEDLNIYRENKTAKALSEIDKAYAGMKTDLFGADATKAREAINKVYNLPRAPKNYGTEYDYLSMKDHARSKIFVKDWSQIKDIEDYLRQNGIEFETDIVQNEWGYKGYHITFRNADGLGAEIQVTQPDVWEVKLKSDKIYEKWRDVEDIHKLSPQEVMEYYADIERSNEMWNHLNLPDFSNFSNSASDSLRAENISSELTGPTAGTQEPLTNSNISLLPDGKTSNIRPVSVKQAMSTPPTDNIPQSPTEVKSNQPQNATETAKGKPANVKNYGTAPKPMQTQEQMPQNYGTVPNAVNLPPKTTAQTEMQQNNINLPPAVENGLQGQNKTFLSESK